MTETPGRDIVRLRINYDRDDVQVDELRSPRAGRLLSNPRPPEADRIPDIAEEHPGDYDIGEVLWELDLDERVRFDTRAETKATLNIENVVCLFSDEKWPKEAEPADTSEAEESNEAPTELRDIDDVGAATADGLREAGFDTIGAVHDASRAELAAVEGISAGVAARIKAGLEDVKSEDKSDDKNRAESQAENQSYEGRESTGSQPDWKPSPGTIQEAGEDEHVFTLEVRETRLVQVILDQFTGYRKAPKTRTVVEYEEGPIRCSCGEAFVEREKFREHAAEAGSKPGNLARAPGPYNNTLYNYDGEGASVLPEVSSDDEDQQQTGESEGSDG